MKGGLLYQAARPFLFALEPESAHHLVLEGLKRAGENGMGAILRQLVPDDPKTVMGLSFPNPVGLAAGLDKDGRYIDALASLGFGFLEVGTVTPRPQPGNAKPRMFRLPQSEALINRMGFNNGGLAAFIANVSAARYKGILGLNIGKNADTPMEEAAQDYLICLRGVYPHASYVSVNISSPNTQNLRQLQSGTSLDELLSLLKAEQTSLAARHQRYVPLALKIAPDLEEGAIEELAAAVRAHQIDAVIATNTTVARDGVAGQEHADETGGLSGAPLLLSSNRVIKSLKRRLEDAVPIIGAGGIVCGESARSKVEAGAALVQLYTGLIYRGPALVKQAARALRAVKPTG
ncbi:MAG: quinone-dependent dihydroorotate dehydrogenase [Burkholderiaceae bacterium]|jgi:dihydroorotate dehydrogenase